LTDDGLSDRLRQMTFPGAGRTRNSKRPVPSSSDAYPKHNAHRFETVTVYYRWHPLFGQSLRVHRRMKTRNGEQIFCQLPDSTLCALPSDKMSDSFLRVRP
jgi:hypothetical protein